MNLPFFIARRIAFSGKRSFSSIIIRIAIVAVSLSVAVMIAASALIAGFKSEISKKIFEFWGHIHISSAITDSPSSDATPVPDSLDFVGALRAVRQVSYSAPKTFLGFEMEDEVEHQSYGGIRHVQAFALKPGIIRSKTAMEGIVLKGVDNQFDWKNLSPYLEEGQPPMLSDTAPSQDILISRQTSNRLQVGVGDKFIVHFVKESQQAKRLFKVCGIYKTGLEEYDKKFALCDLRQVQELLNWQPNQVAGFEVWLDDLRDLETYNRYIYDEMLPPDLVSASIRERFPAIFEWLQLQDLNEVVILGLMLAVAIINMITALMVLVLERTNMIGILKALGESNGRIRQVFLYHAAVITLNGMFWGNAIGIGLCLLQRHFRFIKLNEADYYLSYAPVKFDWTTIATINLGTLAITVLFLIVPSLVVSKIAPVRAIRFR
jgi:lipoprotein-releasing system permease protein